MSDADKETSLSIEQQFRLYARRLQIWRLCPNARCHRAHACRGEQSRCVLKLADWIEAVRDAAQRERNARDPEAQALRAALHAKLTRLAQTVSS